MDVLKDMLDTARAHEQWAMSLEATSSEAATCTVFAAQIRDWVEQLRATPAGLPPTEAQKDEAYQEALHRPVKGIKP